MCMPRVKTQISDSYINKCDATTFSWKFLESNSNRQVPTGQATTSNEVNKPFFPPAKRHHSHRHFRKIFFHTQQKRPVLSVQLRNFNGNYQSSKKCNNSKHTHTSAKRSIQHVSAVLLLCFLPIKLSKIYIWVIKGSLELVPCLCLLVC